MLRSLYRLGAALNLCLIVGACAATPQQTFTAVKPAETVSRRDNSQYHWVGTPPVQHRMDTVGLGLADLGDAGSTAAALASGATELNPALAATGGAAPLVALPLKYAVKRGMVASGATPARANLSVGTGGMVGTCANIAGLAGVHPVAAVAVGVTCGAIYNNKKRKAYEQATNRTVDGRPLR